MHLEACSISAMRSKLGLFPVRHDRISTLAVLLRVLISATVIAAAGYGAYWLLDKINNHEAAQTWWWAGMAILGLIALASLRNIYILVRSKLQSAARNSEIRKLKSSGYKVVGEIAGVEKDVKIVETVHQSQGGGTHVSRRKIIRHYVKAVIHNSSGQPIEVRSDLLKGGYQKDFKKLGQVGGQVDVYVDNLDAPYSLFVDYKSLPDVSGHKLDDTKGVGPKELV